MQENEEMQTYTNPVITGDWSDPGVVRVGEDYYSVRSTFGWQPGLHIAHSKDLIHWRYIGFADTADAFGRPYGICEGGIWGPISATFRTTGPFWSMRLRAARTISLPAT